MSVFSSLLVGLFRIYQPADIKKTTIRGYFLTQMTEQMLCTFKSKILKTIYCQIQDKGRWRPRWNSEIDSYNLYKDLNIVDDTKTRSLG